MGGDIFIVAAASGTGKTNLIRSLINKIPSIEFCISYTTRLPRKGEQNAKDYFFISHPEFERMIVAGEFIEHALVYGNHYGTSKKELENRRAAGNIILLELDWQGAVSLKKLYPAAQSIFVLPPSIEHLTLRLKKRGTDSAEIIEERANIFRDEIAQHHYFDYLIVNEDFEKAGEHLYCIVTAHQLRFAKQQKELKDLLAQLSS